MVATQSNMFPELTRQYCRLNRIVTHQRHAPSGSKALWRPWYLLLADGLSQTLEVLGPNSKEGPIGLCLMEGRKRLGHDLTHGSMAFCLLSE